MKTVMFGECSIDRTFALRDPNFATESDFEFFIAKAMTCAYPNYSCIVFGGTFLLEDENYCPDLAMVAKDLSHWFVVEVELVTHSLNYHVLPQVRAFRYGEPQADCAQVFAKELSISLSRAKTLVNHVPRSVVVIANRHKHEWQMALRGLDTELLVVSVYESSSGQLAYEVDGALEVTRESLGFGRYSATDRSLLFHRETRLPHTRVQISDTDGAPSWWVVTQAVDALWVTKEVGSLDVQDGAYLQIIKTAEGRLALRHIV